MVALQESLLPRSAAEPFEGQGALPRSCAFPVLEMPRPAPRGRPPKGYIWCGHGYVHHESFVPYSHDAHEAVMLDVWRQMRLLRYYRNVRSFRTKRIESQAKARIAKGIKPRRQKLKNATLARSPVEEVNDGISKL